MISSYLELRFKIHTDVKAKNSFMINYKPFWRNVKVNISRKNCLKSIRVEGPYIETLWSLLFRYERNRGTKVFLLKSSPRGIVSPLNVYT